MASPKKLRKDSDSTDSELSELDTTPEPPRLLSGESFKAPAAKIDESFEPRLASETARGESPALPAPCSSNGQSSVVRLRVVSAALWKVKEIQAVSALSSTVDQDQSPVPDAKEVLSEEVTAVPEKANPTLVKPRRSPRVTKPPKSGTEEIVPCARKAPARRQSGVPKQADGTQKRAPRKQTKEDGLVKATRRRKPASSANVPAEGAPTDRAIKKPRTRRTTSDHLSARITPIEGNDLKIPSSPPLHQADVLNSAAPIDPELLRLSKALTHREPLSSKPLPIGKPKVWAPGRQELCETLPYFQAGHSGCYANGGNVYGFMFDSASVGREYMGQDVIIARMGGSMAKDAKTGVIYQTENHDINDNQPQSLLNNITQRNPLIIICGSHNEGSITRMPHRYCVLDWFKPTHVWAEKTLGRNHIVRTTIRYRFERLDKTTPPWYAAQNHTDTSSDPALPIRECHICGKTCPQIYLIGWICTNPECDALWKLPDGRDAPYGELDYHPGFLLANTPWERNDPPFSVSPGVPQIGQYFGDNLSAVNTRGIVCPDCGRCNTRYLFIGWRCDTQGCKWKLMPQHQVVMPSNLHHNPWDMATNGPSLIKSSVKPAIHTTIRYCHNYKVVKYTIEGVNGSVIVAKANQKVVSELGGPNDMFREIQSTDIGLERRMLRRTADVNLKLSNYQGDFVAGAGANDPAVAHAEPDVYAEEALNAGGASADPDEETSGNANEDDHHKVEVGARMTAFGMNFGMPYKFIANGESQSFDDAPEAIRAARSRLNWAQRVFINDPNGYQDFNEELVFAYLEGQKIKYHDDGEKGLGPRIATLSLGAAATMSLRVKTKYFCPISTSGVFTDAKPLPLPLLESSGYTSGFKGKTKTRTQSKDSYEGRMAAWEELQCLKQAGDTDGYRRRSKELPKELGLRRKQADPILSFHLTHGDIVIMEGEQIQKYLEHQVEPHGNLRFALTCRTVLPNHLTPEQLPPYEVEPDSGRYDGSAIREDEDGEAVTW